MRRASRRSVTPLDREVPETRAPALQGVTAACITFFPDPAFQGAVDRPDLLCEAAKDAGVRHLVLLSSHDIRHIPISFADFRADIARSGGALGDVRHATLPVLPDARLCQVAGRLRPERLFTSSPQGPDMTFTGFEIPVSLSPASRSPALLASSLPHRRLSLRATTSRPFRNPVCSAGFGHRRRGLLLLAC